MILGLFTIHNMLYSYFQKNQMENAALPLLERSQQVAKKLEPLEDLTKRGAEWSNATLPFDQDHGKVRFIILNEEDRVLSDTYGYLKAGETLRLELAQKVREENNYSYQPYRNSKGENILYTAYPVFNEEGKHRATILAMTSLGEPKEKLSGLLRRIDLYGLTFIIFSLLLYFILLQKNLSALDGLDQGVQAMSRGNYGYQILDEEKSELSSIVSSFNTLGARLGDIEMQQKEFVSTLSHELKTPIASMKIITDSLLQARDTIDKSLLYEFLEDINSESDRLKDIIDDLLFMATLEKKDVSLTLDTRPITKALEESLRILQPIAEQKGIKLHWDIQEKLFAEFDYNKMKQVFINLISNAVKYTDEGGDVYAEISGSKDMIHIVIRDTGIGIAKESLPYIFDRFYRVDKARSRERGGTGLGLHIVQQIINLHDGKISVSSEPDVGTTFTIDIPRKYEV